MANPQKITRFKNRPACTSVFINPNSEVWTRSRPRPSSSMRRISEDDDEHEEESPISEFRINQDFKGG